MSTLAQQASNNGAPPCAEAQLDAALFAALLIDPDNAIAAVNPAAEELFARSALRLVGCDIEDILKPADPHVQAAIRIADSPLIARNVTAALGGVLTGINISKSPVPSHPGWSLLTLDDAGSSTGDNGDAADMSGHAPAVLAHEIKNPLAAIRAASQLLGRSGDSEKHKQLTELIAAEVDRIAALIDQMQYLGRQRSTPPASFNLHQAVRSALTTMRVARGGNVEISEQFDPSLPAPLGQRADFEQVIINLVSNALDAVAERDDGKVTVRTRYAGDIGFHSLSAGKPVRLPLEIAVSDNGPGLPPELAAHIFEPFVSSKSGGQGLGLALVRKLVHDMGGRISHSRDVKASAIDDENGETGQTHFKVYLPIAETDMSTSDSGGRSA